MLDRGELSMESRAGWEAEGSHSDQQGEAAVVRTEGMKSEEFDDSRLNKARRFRDDYEKATTAGDTAKRMEIEDLVKKDQDMLDLFRENAPLLMEKGFEPLLQLLFGQEQLQKATTVPLEAVAVPLNPELRQAAEETLDQVQELAAGMSDVTSNSSEMALALSPTGGQEATILAEKTQLLQEASARGDAKAVTELISWFKEVPLPYLQAKILAVTDYVGVSNLSEKASLAQFTGKVLNAVNTVKTAMSVTPWKSAPGVF